MQVQAIFKYKHKNTSEILETHLYRNQAFSCFLFVTSTWSALFSTWHVIYLPHKEAEEAEQRVHESDIMGDAGDDCLLTVWTHSLHWRGLEHFPLQYSHCGRCSWRSQDSRRVASHVDKVTGTRTHLSWHRVKVSGWRWIGATCLEVNSTLCHTWSCGTYKLVIYHSTGDWFVKVTGDDQQAETHQYLYNIKVYLVVVVALT